MEGSIAGALCKHFPSRRDLLSETVRRRGRQVGEVNQVVDAQMLGNARAQLHVMGRMLMQKIANYLPALRIVMRESDDALPARLERTAVALLTAHGLITDKEAQT